MGVDSQDKKDASKNTASPNNINASTHLLAAGIAAAVSAVSVQPLDVLKTRLQTNVALRQNLVSNIRHIFKHEGVRGLYRGLVPTLGSVVPSISIYFTLYNLMKQSVGCPSGDPLRDVVVQSAAAGIASMATATITNPLWLIKTRLQTQPIYKNQTHSKSTWQTFRAIVREEGFRGLYKGLGASFLASTQAMVQFPIYEELKLVMCNSDANVKTKTFSYLAASAISASLACILTYPSEVVRARLQAQGHVRIYDGIFHAFRKIYVCEGTAGLYRGLMTSLIKMTPAHAISFTTYEYMLRFLTDNTLPELDVCKLQKNENVQYSFRPYNFTQPAPKLNFYQFPLSSRYNPKMNPYSFSPSFTHLLSPPPSPSNTTNDINNPSPSSPSTKCSRWSEYFW